jgi:hypothetical protein
VRKEVRVRLRVVGVVALFVALPFGFFAIGNWAGKKTAETKAAAFCDAVAAGMSIATVQQAARSERTPFWHQPDSLAYHFRFNAPGKKEAICEVQVEANGAVVSRRTRPIALTPNLPQ